MARLGDVCTIVSGTTPKSDHPEYWDGDINWITPAELTDESDTIFESQRKITQQAVSDSSLKPFPPGTVLLSSRAPIGKVAIAGVEMYCNQGFKNLICSDVIYNRYLYHFLKGKTDYLNSLGRGATFKEISKSIVEGIEIPLPPLDEQRKIAAALDKVSGLIAKRRQQLDKLDELVKARFVEMFGDPVVNPYRFPMVKLGSVLTVEPQNGLYKPQSDYVVDGSGIPILRIDGFYNGKVTDFQKLKRLLCSDEEIQKFLLHENDIVINRVNSIEYLGKCGLIQGLLEETVYESNMMRLHIDESKFNVYYIVYLLCSQFIYNQILGKAKKSVNQASINQKDVQGLMVYIPALTLQNQFAALVEQTEKTKATVSRSLEKLETLKKALMQKYFG